MLGVSSTEILELPRVETPRGQIVVLFSIIQFCIKFCFEKIMTSNSKTYRLCSCSCCSGGGLKNLEELRRPTQLLNFFVFDCDTT